MNGSLYNARIQNTIKYLVHFSDEKHLLKTKYYIVNNNPSEEVEILEVTIERLGTVVFEKHQDKKTKESYQYSYFKFHKLDRRINTFINKMKKDRIIIDQKTDLVVDKTGNVIVTLQLQEKRADETITIEKNFMSIEYKDFIRAVFRTLNDYEKSSFECII